MNSGKRTLKFDTPEFDTLDNHLADGPGVSVFESPNCIEERSRLWPLYDSDRPSRRYWTAAKDYAVALAQQDPDWAVTAMLYFTTPGVAETFAWSPEELAELAAAFEERIERELPTV